MYTYAYNGYFCIMIKTKRSKRERKHLVIKRIVSLLIFFACAYLAYNNYNPKENLVLAVITLINFVWSISLFTRDLDYRKDYSDER